MFGTLLAGKFQFLQISERCRAPRRAAKLKSVIMLPYFHRFLNLASTLRIHLARQAHLQTLSQNHKTLQISSQIFQTCSYVLEAWFFGAANRLVQPEIFRC